MRFFFPKENRLLKKKQFLRVKKEFKKRFLGNLIIVDARPNSIKKIRIGITITNRFGKAHERNRLKRLIREAFRLDPLNLNFGWDIVVKARQSAHEASFNQIKNELNRFFIEEIND